MNIIIIFNIYANHALENFVTLESVGFLPNVELHCGSRMEKGETSSMSNDTIFWKLSHGNARLKTFDCGS